MGQDLRTLYRDAQEEDPRLKEGHLNRFEQKLDRSFQKKSSNNIWLSIAAMIVVVFAVTYTIYKPTEDKLSNQNTIKTTTLSLGDLSPELKKVETFYTQGIQLEMASLSSESDSKLVKAYFDKKERLDQSYAELETELNDHGPTEENVQAMIDNLQLRLQLLFQLKNRLKTIKSNNDESKTII